MCVSRIKDWFLVKLRKKSQTFYPWSLRLWLHRVRRLKGWMATWNAMAMRTLDAKEVNQPAPLSSSKAKMPKVHQSTAIVWPPRENEVRKNWSQKTQKDPESRNTYKYIYIIYQKCKQCLMQNLNIPSSSSNQIFVKELMSCLLKQSTRVQSSLECHKLCMLCQYKPASGKYPTSQITPIVAARSVQCKTVF